jgi:competence protein ComEC
MVFLSHPDADHIGGTPEILQRYRVGVVFTNGDESDSEIYRDFKKSLAESGTREIVLSRGDRVRYGDAEFRVLWPPKEYEERGDESNENSLVLLFSHAGRNSLYTGDAPEKIEKLFLSDLPLVDVLKVGHHGSKYSTGEDLLLKTRPRLALIGVGKNSYGHPSSETLQRLQKFGIPVFRTDEKGTLRVPFSEPLAVFSVE